MNENFMNVTTILFIKVLLKEFLIAAAKTPVVLITMLPRSLQWKRAAERHHEFVKTPEAPGPILPLNHRCGRHEMRQEQGVARSQRDQRDRQRQLPPEHQEVDQGRRGGRGPPLPGGNQVEEDKRPQFAPGPEFAKMTRPGGKVVTPGSARGRTQRTPECPQRPCGSEGCESSEGYSRDTGRPRRPGPSSVRRQPGRGGQDPPPPVPRALPEDQEQRVQEQASPHGVHPQEEGSLRGQGQGQRVQEQASPHGVHPQEEGREGSLQDAE